MVSPSQRRRPRSRCSETARASRSGGRARSSVSTAPPSATGRSTPIPTGTSAPSSGTSPATIPAGAIDGPMPCSVGRATTAQPQEGPASVA